MSSLPYSTIRALLFLLVVAHSVPPTPIHFRVLSSTPSPIISLIHPLAHFNHSLTAKGTNARRRGRQFTPEKPLNAPCFHRGGSSQSVIFRGHQSRDCRDTDEYGELSVFAFHPFSLNFSLSLSPFILRSFSLFCLFTFAHTFLHFPVLTLKQKNNKNPCLSHKLTHAHTRTHGHTQTHVCSFRDVIGLVALALHLHSLHRAEKERK